LLSLRAFLFIGAQHIMAVDTNILSLMYAALEAVTRPGQYGIVVRTSSVPQLRTKVSQTRKEHGDPELDKIECRPSPLDPNEVWMLVRGTALPEGDPLAEAMAIAETTIHDD
jgi:hypothetical protein